MAFGASFANGEAQFRFWAPGQERVAIAVVGGAPRPMQPRGDGWHELRTPELAPGTRYRYVLASGEQVPDPASRFQPDGVHGPSELIDPAAYSWRDERWRGRPWREAIVYELHVGCFTSEGTYRALESRLDHLVRLGVTALELMPIAEFPGQRNWGYDGVLLFAPAHVYGRPEDLKALVDAAHQRGLIVLLDAVYNHFGPEGNYTGLYWPQLVTTRHHTPWGGAVNFDDTGSARVREFIVANALYWLEEYHFDGLRLDAVHAIKDDGPVHVLDELAKRVRAAFAGRREVHLLLENEENEAQRLQPLGPYTAQWNDDVHHGLHVALTDEAFGYYGEYHADPAKLPRSLAEGFAYQGEVMTYRGSPRGTRSTGLPPTAFVSFLQNHDQVGNRALGERASHLAGETALRAVAAVFLLAPQVPMLFMGEEWAASTPFLFFCDLSEALREAVREGRRAEFAKFPQFQDAKLRESIPDPTAVATFERSRLRWEELNEAGHAAWLEWHRAVLDVRARSIVPLLAGIGPRAGEWRCHGRAFVVRWTTGGGAFLAVTANLSAEAVALEPAPGRVLWSEGPPQETGRLPPWSVRWTLQAST